MRKILNTADSFVDDALEGILLAHPDRLRRSELHPRVIVRNRERSGRVGIVTGGGFGHLPAFLGYIGEGLVSSAAVGNVFSAQAYDAAQAAIVEADEGAGVLCLYGNYTGDRLNFELACDLVNLDGTPTRTVIAGDDVASADAEHRSDRRGVAGLFFAYKCAGASAARGDDLETVSAIAQRAADAVRTIGVGLSPTILPANGAPTFEIPEGAMEVGIGIHGEHGAGGVQELGSAHEIAEMLIGALIPESGTRVDVLVNGMGATPLEELYVLGRSAALLLRERGVEVRRTFVGEYMTSLEMAGASVSLFSLDDELEALMNEPADAALLNYF